MIRASAFIIAALLALAFATSHAGPPRPTKTYRGPDGPLVRGFVQPVELEPFETSSTLFALLAEYEPGVREMDIPVGTSLEEFEQILGDGPLGSWMTDAMRDGASRALGETVDIAFINGGGIRDSLPAGPVSEVDILKLMPFENELVIMTVTGAQLEWLADSFAASRGSFPISGAEIIADSERRLVTIVVAGRPVDRTRLYTLATSDYMLSAGDNLGIPGNINTPIESQMRVRDAMMHYAREQSANGGMIPPRDGWRYCYDGLSAQELP